MSTRVAINGLGPIGRATLELLTESCGSAIRWSSPGGNEWGYANQMVREAVAIARGLGGG